VPDTATGLDQLESDHRAVLHQLSLTANVHLRCGAFGQWESAWYRQHNSGYTTPLAGEDVWQHNVSIGYRFPRRHAELRVGLLNILDQDYRLNPLNLRGDLPRDRTVAVSFRINF
jgi:outer membrane receptor protein involved in Fe transport